MRGNDSVHLDKPLGMPSGLEPPHASLSLTRRLMRVLRAVVQVPMPSMKNFGHYDPFRRP
jgi:hypothetical protein